METLQINRPDALKAYKKGSKEIKDFMAALFGEKIFSQKITDQVKTFEDACAIIEVTSAQKMLLDYNGSDKDMIAAQAVLKLTIIAKALNEGWTPDWNNSNQYKYSPWFKMKSGFGLSYYVCDDTYSITYIGSRLVFKTAELAIYAGQQFESIYQDFLNL